MLVLLPSDDGGDDGNGNSLTPYLNGDVGGDGNEDAPGRLPLHPLLLISMMMMMMMKLRMFCYLTVQAAANDDDDATFSLC